MTGAGARRAASGAPVESNVLLRPNPAGKTTLFRVLAGDPAASLGQVVIAGRDPHADPHARLLIGVGAHRTALHRPAAGSGMRYPEIALRSAMAVQARAIGSAGERLVHTEEVTGSIPVSPTS
jgi:ABC-type branched-subunit amino acid transport system ATPase component